MVAGSERSASLGAGFTERGSFSCVFVRASSAWTVAMNVLPGGLGQWYDHSAGARKPRRPIVRTRMRLSFACGDYDRLRPLRDGRVRAEGLELTFLTLGPEETFHRQIVHREFDASEMSLGSYVTGMAQGSAPFVAIPIFPSRAFRHSSAYVNTSAGIARPEDLSGKRVGVAEYQLTANVWLRGILDDEYGVRATEVRWFVGGLDQAGRRLKQTLVLPPEIHLEAISSDDTLSGMLERGDLDAVFTPRMPGPFVNGSARIRRLFPDYRRAEADYFRRTGIFPIMHTVVIRRDLYERDRWVAQSLVK